MNPPIILPSESVIARNNANILCNVLHDEIVIMDLKNGNYLNLNRIGSSIWDIIENPISIDALIQHLLSQYEVAESECREHVLEFLETLQKNDLLEIKA